MIEEKTHKKKGALCRHCSLDPCCCDLINKVDEIPATIKDHYNEGLY